MLVKVLEAQCFRSYNNHCWSKYDKGIGYHLVGLPDNAIKESSYRIAAALKIMDIPCPVKDNHQHGSCRLAEGRLCLWFNLTIGTGSIWTN
jgi:hypothetical protein